MKKHIIVYKKEGDSRFTEATVPYDNCSKVIGYIDDFIRKWHKIDGSIEIYDGDTLDLIECV